MEEFYSDKFAFVERSGTMKAPVGLSSDRTVLRQQNGGISSRQVPICPLYLLLRPFPAIFSNPILIPFRIYFLEPNGQKHPLALRVEGVDIGFYPFHPLFPCQLYHLQNAPPPDVLVLERFTYHNGNSALFCRETSPTNSPSYSI